MKMTYHNRSGFFGAFLGTAIAIGIAGSAWGWVDMSRVSHVGDTWYVTPSTDEERDIDTVQYAIDSASPGEIVLLKQGIFDFGYIDPTDPFQTKGVIVNTENLTIRGETTRDGTGDVDEWLTVIKGGGNPAIGLLDSKFTVVEGLWLHEPFWIGLQLVRANVEAGGAVIRGNRFSNVQEALVPGWYQIFSTAIAIGGRTAPGNILIEGNMIVDDSHYTPTMEGPDGLRRDDPSITWYANRNGIFVQQLATDIEILKNKIRNLDGNGIQVYRSRLYELVINIEHNDIKLAAGEFAIYGGIKVAGVISIVNILDNRIETERGYSGAGMELAGFLGAPAPFTVTGNDINLGSGLAGMVLGRAGVKYPLVGGVISGNMLKGTAQYGLLLNDAFEGYETTLNSVELEKLSKFEATEAHIYCGVNTTTNTCFVDHLGDLIIVDQGTDNVFVELD